MAQQDTGLGWEAKSEWLQSVSGQLCTVSIGGPESGMLVPYYPDDPRSNPTLANASALQGNPTYPCNMFAVTTPNATVCIFNVIDTYYGDHTYLCTTRSGVQYNDWWAPNASTAQYVYFGRNIGTYDSTTGLYYNASTARATPAGIPSFNTLAEGLAAYKAVLVPIEKSNAGYSVACVAKWKTQSNVVITSPVLISSDTSYTDMSTTGSYSFAKYNTRRDGMTFYMSFFQDITAQIQSTLPVYDISGPSDPYANLDELFNLLCAPDQANVRVTETVDPYEDFPYTSEDGGEVDPDPEDDEIEVSDLPTMSFATAGFCRIYRPSFGQVSALASYMWTDQNFLQTVINHLKQILENPIDAIISLSIVPCTPNVLPDEEVKVMYVPTGVYMPPVQRQFVSVDCGSYTLKEMYGSALDYNSYTSVQLYLPYVGIVQLDTDEVMGKTISIGYRIDVVTGVCCAYVKANNDVLYQFSGHCSIQQPITSADFSGYINAALAAGKLVASIAAAGAGAPAVAATLAGAPTPSISGTESKTVETERNPNTGRQITVGTRRRESQTYNPGASFGEVATRGVSNTVGAVMNSKTIVQHSGGFSGNSGFMAAVRRPYLIVTRPRIANPENYGKYNGRPSMIYLNLGDCTGFTQVQSIQLTGIDATNPELSEITTLLNSGVIL